MTRPPNIVRDVAGLRESLRFSEVLLSRVKRAPEYQWVNVGTGTAPALGDGWSNYSDNEPPKAPIGYFKTRDGWVFLRGFVASAAGANPTLFTLPLGYRPPYREVFMELYGRRTATRNNMLVIEPDPVRIDIFPTGEVQVQPPNAGPFQYGLSLGGLRFRSYVPTY